jgi:selenocysteine lyase/cysteine desulfurase
LYVAPGVERQLASTRQGGTGTQSDDDHQPEALPYKYEAGSTNVPGVVGLEAGVDYLRMRGLEDVRRHQLALTERLMAGFAELPGVLVYGHPDAQRRVGVVSISLTGFDPQEAAAALDAVYRIQVRSGYHCAPLLHRALGTIETGGTVRFSVGATTTLEDVDAAIAAVGEMAAEAAVR